MKCITPNEKMNAKIEQFEMNIRNTVYLHRRKGKVTISEGFSPSLLKVIHHSDRHHVN